MEALASRNETTDQKQFEHLKAYDDVITQFSELVDGSMRTSFELSFDGHELYGRDGRAMGEVTQVALDDAHKIIKNKPNLSFELRRRQLERNEYLLALKMAKGELPNTMIIPSDFPGELADATEDVGGYNVTRKQTMNRVLARKPDGNVQMYSQSLDGSDRPALEAIYGHFGVRPQPGELLGQRIHVDLSPEVQDTLIDRLTGIYDRSLRARHGGEWYAGRRPADYRNTYDFVCDQHDLVQACVKLKLNDELDDNTMYDMAATMQKRFKAEKQGVINMVSRLATVNPVMLQHEIQLAGLEARQAGQSFSACGATLRADGIDVSTNNDLAEAGFGNKTSELTTYKFDKKMHCVVCQKTPSKTETKKMCGPCGLCRGCDKKASVKG